MTCIVAVRSKANIYLGGDSAATTNVGTQDKLARPKVFRKGKMLIGCAGSIRALQILEHSFTAPKHEKSLNGFEYCATSLITSIRSCLKSNDFSFTSHNYSSFLIAYDNHIFQTNTADFSVIEYSADYAAIGAGFQFAIGSLHTTKSQSPESRVRKALEASAEHDVSVAGPFYCINLRSKEAYLL